MQRPNRTAYIGVILVLLWAAALLWQQPATEEERLERYVLLAQQDPILALPGTDLGSLDRAVEALEKSSRIARPNLAGGSSAPLYPFAFLAALPEAEEARRELIGDPSVAAAHRYHAALLVLLSAHERDLLSFEQAVQGAPQGASFAYLSGSTTAAFVAGSLARARERTLLSAEEERRRFACLSGRRSWCPQPVSRMLPPSSLRESPVGALSSDARAVRDILRAYDATRYPGESRTVLLSSSACYPDIAPMPYDVSYARSRLTGIPMVWPRPLHDLYFFDLARTDRPSLVALREAGLSYEYEPWSAYLCPDAGFDLGAMLTVLYVRDELSRRPLRSAHAGLMRAQERLLREDIPSEASFMLLANEASLARVWTKDPAEALRLDELVLLSRTRTAQFDRIVGYFDDLQIGTRLFFSERGVPPHEFALTRSGLSPLLLLYSGRFPTRLTQAPGTLSSEETLSLRSYRRDLASQIPFEAVPGLLSRDLEVRESLYGPRIEALKQERAR